MDNKLYNYKYYKVSMGFQTKRPILDKFVSLIKELKPTRVLDVGCGIGTLVKRLNSEGIQAIGIDFSDALEEFWGDDDNFFQMDATQIDFPDKSFDVVFSSDFFEHIAEEDIDKVTSEMKRVGKKIIAFVADDTGGPLHRRQAQYHLTHKPIEWWDEKLEGIEVHSSQYE